MLPLIGYLGSVGASEIAGKTKFHESVEPAMFLAST